MNTQFNTNFQGAVKEKEINIKEHFLLLKRWFWIIILITIITTSIAMVKNAYYTTPLYSSSTRMFIDADKTLMSSLLVLIRDNTVLKQVAAEIGETRTPSRLAQQISVGSVDGSQVVNINVIDIDPATAAKIANTTAMVFKNEVPSIVDFINENRQKSAPPEVRFIPTDANVKLLTEAQINPYPINSNQNQNIVIAFIIGIVLGVGIIYFIDSLDDSVKSADEVENLLGYTVIGTIPKMKKKNMKKKNSEAKNKEIRGESVGH